MERVEEPVAPVVEVTADETGYGLPGSEAYDSGREGRHGREGVERPGPESLADDGVVDGADRGEEVVETLRIPRVEPRHGGLHPLAVGSVVEVASVVEPDPVEGVERHERHVVPEPLARRAKHIVDEVRGGDQGRARVEDVAGIAELSGAPAELRTLLDERRRDAGGLKADGGGQPAETAPDHHRFPAHGPVRLSRFPSGPSGEAGGPCDCGASSAAARDPASPAGLCPEGKCGLDG